MLKRSGFTLVELLVVVAIIAILASIIVPNVTRYIARGQMAKAVSEINSIELAMTAMLADAERSSFRDFFTTEGLQGLVELNLQGTLAIYDTYTDIMYALLRTGRNARSELPAGMLDDKVLNKLSTNYLDLTFDPWGQKYQFYLGRARIGTSAPMPFRGYLTPTDGFSNGVSSGVADGIIDSTETIKWTDGRRSEEDLPGAPPADNMVGRPATDSQPFFVWSKGGNLRHDQEFGDPASGNTNSLVNPDGFYRGGGDDINNWDPNTGWSVHYGGG